MTNLTGGLPNLKRRKIVKIKDMIFCAILAFVVVMVFLSMKNGGKEITLLSWDATFPIGDKVDETEIKAESNPEKPEIEFEEPESKAPANENATITSENNKDFAEVLMTGDETVVQKFAEENWNRMIEFDGHIADVSPFKGNETRFNLLIYSGDYSENDFSGPRFGIENMEAAEIPGIDVDENVHVVAVAGEFDADNRIWFIYPESITPR
jgi:hypothetical protein